MGNHEVCHVFLHILGINSYRDLTDLPGKSSIFPEKYFFVKLLTEFGPRPHTARNGKTSLRVQNGTSLVCLPLVVN